MTTLQSLTIALFDYLQTPLTLLCLSAYPSQNLIWSLRLITLSTLSQRLHPGKSYCQNRSTSLQHVIRCSHLFISIQKRIKYLFHVIFHFEHCFEQCRSLNHLPPHGLLHRFHQTGHKNSSPTNQRSRPDHLPHHLLTHRCNQYLLPQFPQHLYSPSLPPDPDPVPAIIHPLHRPATLPLQSS